MKQVVSNIVKYGVVQEDKHVSLSLVMSKLCGVHCGQALYIVQGT